MQQNINSLILVFSVPWFIFLFIQFLRISSLHVKLDKVRVHPCHTALIIKISFTFPLESVTRFMYILLKHFNQMLRVAFFTCKVLRNCSVDFITKGFLKVSKRPVGFLN